MACNADKALPNRKTVIDGRTVLSPPIPIVDDEEDDGEDDADFFSIRSQYFINSNFAVGGAIGFGDDVQALNINATYRF